MQVAQLHLDQNDGCGVDLGSIGVCCVYPGYLFFVRLYNQGILISLAKALITGASSWALRLPIDARITAPNTIEQHKTGCK